MYKLNSSDEVEMLALIMNIHEPIVYHVYWQLLVVHMAVHSTRTGKKKERLSCGMEKLLL